MIKEELSEVRKLLKKKKFVVLFQAFLTLLLVLVMVVYIGVIVSNGVFGRIDNECSKTNDTVITDYGIVHCLSWNLGNYTMLSNLE